MSAAAAWMPARLARPRPVVLRPVVLRRVALPLVALAAFLLATPALAAGGSEAGGGGMKLFWEVLNLAILIGVLIKFAGKPIAGFFSDRRHDITSELEEAGKVLTRAESRFTEWQRKLMDLDAELENIRATARRRAEEERDHILRDARAGAERIRQAATAAVEQEVRKAKAALAEEASRLSLELAEQLLTEQVTSADRDRLMDEFISSVERPATQGQGR